MAHRSQCEVLGFTAVWLKIQVLSDPELWCLRNVGNHKANGTASCIRKP